jgi:hypothetical protein
MVAKGEPLRRLIEETLAAINEFEAAQHSRLRKRRPVDEKNRRDLAQALVVNLAHTVLLPPHPTGRLAIRAGNLAKGAGRYNNTAFGKGVRPLLEQMQEAGLLVFTLPTAMRGEVSSIAPTRAFAGRVRELDIGLSDFGRDIEREEVLVLTRNVGTRAAPISVGLSHSKGLAAGHKSLDHSPMVRIAISRQAFNAIVRTMPVGSVSFEPRASDPKADRLVWLESQVVEKLAAMRGPGESYQRHTASGDLGDRTWPKMIMV